MAYADFTDYHEIIVCRTHWNDVFRAYFQRKQDISGSLTTTLPAGNDNVRPSSISMVEASGEYKRLWNRRPWSGAWAWQRCSSLPNKISYGVLSSLIRGYAPSSTATAWRCPGDTIDALGRRGCRRYPARCNDLPAAPGTSPRTATSAKHCEMCGAPRMMFTGQRLEFVARN